LAHILFGSLAIGAGRRDSDIDVAVDFGRSLTPPEKMNLIGQLAEKTGRAIDLVDLHTTGEPLLAKILRRGVQIVGSKIEYANLIRKHLLDAADFLPYRTRILRERRRAWIGK